MKDRLGDYSLALVYVVVSIRLAIVTIKLVTNVSLLSSNLAVNVNDKPS